MTNSVLHGGHLRNEGIAAAHVACIDWVLHRLNATLLYEGPGRQSIASLCNSHLHCIYAPKFWIGKRVMNEYLQHPLLV